MQRGKLIVPPAPAVAVGWYDMIRAVDMISSEQGLSRVWSHTFAHPAACVWCHYAERMFIVLPAVVWYDIIRARSVTWSESHMCSFLTACVMSLCTEERKVDCTPRPCCYSWLIHVWSGQDLSRGWSHTCGRPSQRTIIYRCSLMSDRLGVPLPPSDGFCNSGCPLCLTLCILCWPDPVVTEKHCIKEWVDVWTNVTSFPSNMVGQAMEEQVCESMRHYLFNAHPPLVACDGSTTSPYCPILKLVLPMFRKTTMGGTDVLLCTCTGSTRCISEVRTDKRNTCGQTAEQAGKQPRKILSVFIICQNSLVLSNQWRQLMLLVDNEHSLGERYLILDKGSFDLKVLVQ